MNKMELNILHQQTLSSVHGSDGGQLGGYSFCELLWEGVIESKACKPNTFTYVRFWLQLGYGQRCVIVDKG